MVWLLIYGSEQGNKNFPSVFAKRKKVCTAKYKKKEKQKGIIFTGKIFVHCAAGARVPRAYVAYCPFPVGFVVRYGAFHREVRPSRGSWNPMQLISPATALASENICSPPTWKLFSHLHKLYTDFWLTVGFDGANSSKSSSWSADGLWAGFSSIIHRINADYRKTLVSKPHRIKQSFHSYLPLLDIFPQILQGTHLSWVVRWRLLVPWPWRKADKVQTRWYPGSKYQP